MFPAIPRFGRRRAFQGAALALAVFGLLVWALLPAEKSPEGKVIFSTGVERGVYERYGQLLQKAAARDLPDLRIRLRGSEGSQQNVERVATSKADFTIAAADAVDQYQRDGLPGADRLRGCVRLYDDYVQLVVAKDSPVRETADLQGRKVAVGQPASGVRLIAERVLRAAGLDPVRDIEPVSSGIGRATEQLERGDIDAFFWSGGLPTTIIREMSERVDIRLIPLGDLVDELHRQGGVSRYYRAAVMPADAYPAAQVGTPVPTLAVANLLVTTDRVDPALIEGLTRTVIDSRDHIGSQVHAAQLVDLRTAIYTDPLALHDGARHYYRSVKP
ncbi:TAXI family TRAP transporter solute-binding subunit [Streptomyces apocyni]|uniref:TAXI family TRAP transporter solute-binding subunit n=1 Tax=Streptomyces apocyni TaxID=2654677 RepID=UPI0012E9ABD7|nr:TAXI family TRAP transporter solute-binding subunit [Streptomyces apocyni]